jgi:hypothetical protein
MSSAKTPAPKKDRIFGSDANKKGSASSGKSAKRITFSDRVETALRNKVSDHNEKVESGKKTSISTLKAVYRRGAGAYSVSHRPGMTRDQWAMGRVNAFLRLLRTGRPENSKYVADNDLLPASHPKSTKKKATTASGGILLAEERALAESLINITEKYGRFDQDGDGVWAGYVPADKNRKADIGVVCANCVFYLGGTECRILALPVEPAGRCRFAVIPEGVVRPEDDVMDEVELIEDLIVALKEASEYSSTDEMLLNIVEYSGLGYESESAFKAVWSRALRDGDDPLTRVLSMAELGYSSQDADLLPRI